MGSSTVSEVTSAGYLQQRNRDEWPQGNREELTLSVQAHAQRHAKWPFWGFKNRPSHPVARARGVPDLLVALKHFIYVLL